MSLFTHLIENGLVKSVYSDKRCVAFLDIRPANRGHCLVVPRVEVDEWTDLDSDLAQHLMAVAQKIGQAQKVAFGSERSGLMIAGFEVAHCHLHVIPINSMADFLLGGPEADSKDLDVVQKKLVASLG